MSFNAVGMKMSFKCCNGKSNQGCNESVSFNRLFGHFTASYIPCLSSNFLFCSRFALNVPSSFLQLEEMERHGQYRRAERKVSAGAGGEGQEGSERTAKKRSTRRGKPAVIEGEFGRSWLSGEVCHVLVSATHDMAGCFPGDQSCRARK